MKASAGVIVLWSMFCWWLVCFNRGTEHTLHTHICSIIWGVDVICSDPEINLSLVYLFFSGWQELCRAWRWAEVTSVQGSLGRRLSQRQGCGRNALPVSRTDTHTHSHSHSSVQPSPSACVSFYATLVLYSAGSILYLVCGEYEWIHQLYKPCLHIFTPCYSPRPVFICSVQFPYFFMDIEMGNAEYNIFLYECVRRLFAHKGLHGEATKASSGNLLFTILSLDTFA